MNKDEEQDRLIREAYLLGKEFSEKRDFQPITKFYAFYTLGILIYFTFSFMYSNMAGFQISTFDLIISLFLMILIPFIIEIIIRLRRRGVKRNDDEGEED